MANYGVNLSVRPVTRLARDAPRPHPPHGRAQAARPPRPAGYAGRSAGLLAVHIFPMADLHDHNDQDHVLDRVENSVFPLPNSILFRSGEFLAARRSRVVS